MLPQEIRAGSFTLLDSTALLKLASVQAMRYLIWFIFYSDESELDDECKCLTPVLLYNILDENGRINDKMSRWAFYSELGSKRMKHGVKSGYFTV